MQSTINLYDAKSHFSALVAAVEETGTRVVICRRGKPVADLMPHHDADTDPLQPDPALTGACFKQDPCAPLPMEDWPEALR